MAESTRKLATIMFTDIVGFTALMGEDEQKAMDLLKKSREVQKPLQFFLECSLIVLSHEAEIFG